jgi:hypothetical protein
MRDEEKRACGALVAACLNFLQFEYFAVFAVVLLCALPIISVCGLLVIVLDDSCLIQRLVEFF